MKCKITEILDCRVQKGLETKDKILQAALELIADKGPKFLSAGNIAKKINISKSSIFHHFKSVEDIPFLVMERVVTQMLDNVGSKETHSVTEYINHLGVEVIEKSSKEKQLARSFMYFMQKAAVNEKYRTSIVKMREVWFSTLKEKIEEIATKKVSKEEMERIIILFSMCHRGLAQFNILREDHEKEKFLEAWELFSQMIGARFGEAQEGAGA